MTTLRALSFLHLWPWLLLAAVLVGVVVLVWPRVDDDPHGDPNGDPVTFSPDDPSTWDCLPAGYAWTAVPDLGCRCIGSSLHLLSADGTDLTRAVLDAREAVSRGR